MKSTHSIMLRVVFIIILAVRCQAQGSLTAPDTEYYMLDEFHFNDDAQAWCRVSVILILITLEKVEISLKGLGIE
jgi:hypothetical protein